MTRSKAITILKTFSEEELKRFRDYVRSPFHNKNKNVIKMYEIVRKSAPRFESEKLRKERIYKYLFPGKEYNDTVMRILISNLIRLCEEFLAYVRYESRPMNEEKYLLDELKERGIDTLYMSHYNSADSLLTKPGRINSFYFFDRFELENKFIDFMISRDEQQSTSPNVQRQGEYLLSFTLINILNIAHELANHKDVLNVKFDFNPVEKFLENMDMEAFMEYLEKNNFKYYPVIAIYYYMYLAYIHYENDEYYLKLRQYTEKFLDWFDEEEQLNLFIILENICSTRISHGQSGYYKKLMEVYELMLSKTLTNRARTFQLNLFRNIFFTAVILEKFEWAENFLASHIDRLLPEYRENMLCYGAAVLDFERGKYEDSLSKISKVGQKFFVYKYDVKILLLKIYYELKEYEPAYGIMDTFSHFLSSNKSVTEVDRDRFRNFLRFYKNLIKASEKSDDYEVQKMKKQLSDTKNVIGRKWLLKKAEEFKLNPEPGKTLTQISTN